MPIHASGHGPAIENDCDELRTLRDEIDRLDDSLIRLMETRLSLASRAAAAKRAVGVDLRDVRREAEVTRRASLLARERGLDPEIVRDIFWRLITLSHRAAGAEDAEASP